MAKAERQNLQDIFDATDDNGVALRILEALPIAAVILDENDQDVLWASNHCRNLFTLSDEDNVNSIGKELVRSPDHARNIREKIKKNGEIRGREAVVMTAGQKLIVVLMDADLITLDGTDHLAFCLQDITERKEAEAELCHDAEADKLMSNISGRLLGIDISGAIADSLRNLGIYLNVDRIAMVPLADESATIRSRHWNSDRLDSTVPGVHTTPLPSLRWIEQQLNAGRSIVLDRIEDLPPEAALDRDILEDIELKSLQVHPIMFQRSLIGFVCMECFAEERHWTTREADLLTQFCNVIGSAVARQQAERQTRHAIKRAEDALKALKGAQSQLIHAEKMAALGDLVAGIAHETSTPLGSAVTTTSALRARTKQLEKAFDARSLKRSDMEVYLDYSREGFQILETNLRRAAELIQSFKRVAVDVSHAMIQTINMHEYLEDILRSIRPRTKKFKGIEIILDCPDDLEVNTEPGALSQVITNLMTNALIHAFDNDLSAEGTIKIHAHLAGDELRLTFSDDGKGMTPEVREKLFDPYFTTKRDQGGSGLGMPIIQDLVQDTLRGRIVVASEPGEGSQFHITFPTDLGKIVAATEPGSGHEDNKA